MDSVPEAVKKQEEEAQAIYEAAYAEPENLGEESTDEETVEEVIAAPAEEVVEEEIEEEVPEEINFQEEYYRLKAANEVLTGKYDAEVPRLYQEIQTLKEQVEKIHTYPQGRLDDEGEPAVDPVSRLSEDYGEEFVDDLRTLFKSEFTNSMEPVQSRMEATEAVAMQTSRERYFTTLTELVPDWQTIVREPVFTEFSKELDEFAGVPRYALMQSAEGNLDANRMAKFYDAFKVRTGKAKPASNKGKKLAALTPGGGSKSSAGGAAKPDYISEQEIEKFSTDVALRRYVGREEEQKAMETRIDKAITNRWVV